MLPSACYIATVFHSALKIRTGPYICLALLISGFDVRSICPYSISVKDGITLNFIYKRHASWFLKPNQQPRRIRKTCRHPFLVVRGTQTGRRAGGGGGGHFSVEGKRFLSHVECHRCSPDFFTATCTVKYPTLCVYCAVHRSTARNVLLLQPACTVKYIMLCVYYARALLEMFL